MKAKSTSREKWVLVLVCSFLTAFQPALGAPPVVAIGRVSGRGLILLNGVAAPTGANVYTGNRIATGPGHGAAVHVALTHGDKLVLGGSTLTQITESATGFSVELDQGVVGAVSDRAAPVVIEVHGVTIRTKQASGAYEVALNGSTLRVLPRQGGVLVEATNQTVEVKEGKLLKAKVGPTQSKSHKRKNELAVVVLVAAANVGATLGLALSEPTSATGKKVASPSVP